MSSILTTRSNAVSPGQSKALAARLAARQQQIWSHATSNLMDYLRRRTALVSFDIQLEVKTTSSGARVANWQDTFYKEQNEVGKSLAEAARKTMSKWLSPSGDYGIGVSGGASRNLYVQSVFSANTGTHGSVVWYVAEGNKTKANRFIRQGVGPSPAKSRAAQSRGGQNRGKGHNTSFHGAMLRLAEWVRARGLARTVGKKRPSDMISRRLLSKRPKHKIRVRGLDDEATVWAVWHSIRMRGSSAQYEKDWGQRYFDYPREYATGRAQTLRHAFNSRWSSGGDAYARVTGAMFTYLRTEFTAIKGKALNKRRSGSMGMGHSNR